MLFIANTTILLKAHCVSEACFVATGEEGEGGVLTLFMVLVLPAQLFLRNSPF
jgi:hypothetical protein